MTTLTPERAADPTPEARKIECWYHPGAYIELVSIGPNTTKLTHSHSDGNCTVWEAIPEPIAKVTKYIKLITKGGRPK